jgi:hypothetical protein
VAGSKREMPAKSLSLVAREAAKNTSIDNLPKTDVFADKSMPSPTSNTFDKEAAQ